MTVSQVPLLRSPGRSSAPPERILLVSNRLPVTASREGRAIRFRPSDGGLASGLRTVHRPDEGLWIGWSGLDGFPDPAAEDGYADSLEAASAVAVPLSTAEIAGYYRGFSNGALWPALHGCIREPVVQEGDWELYRGVNARYADIVGENLTAGDRVWIHDYHLLLVPGLLRARCPGARIGLFLHTPFPPPECFAALPQAAELLRGMLGADVIGFHTRDYTRHFASAVRLLLGQHRRSVDEITHPHRSKLVTCPMGIDAAFFAGLARRPAVRAGSARIRSQSGGPLFVGVDRLDYTKGLPKRLLAFERLLELEPGLQGRARLIQIAVPTREDVVGYQETQRWVESLVDRINSRFRSGTWIPIDYRHGTVDTETLVALYLAADVMLVTPLCDGMNLVAKEFVACRNDEDGVLVLSSQAGAAAELHAAVIADPHSRADLVRAYRTALAMLPGERQARMQRLRLVVESRDVTHWSMSFLAALGRPKPPAAEGDWSGEEDRPARLRLI